MKTLELEVNLQQRYVCLALGRPDVFAAFA